MAKLLASLNGIVYLSILLDFLDISKKLLQVQEFIRAQSINLILRNNYNSSAYRAEAVVFGRLLLMPTRSLGLIG